MRQKFFGKEASTLEQEKVLEKNKGYQHFKHIRDTAKIKEIFKKINLT
jgi:hypothetical protein